MDKPIKYHKIENIFQRNNKTKRLIEGKFRNPYIEYLYHNKWEISEKVDGTNIRVHWDGYEISFYGRKSHKIAFPNLEQYLIDTFQTPEMEDLFESKFGAMPVTLYGEGYGPKIQGGHKYRDDVSFILFDVLVHNEEHSIYLAKEDVANIAHYFGIEHVPYMYATLSEFVDYMKKSEHLRNSQVCKKPYNRIVEGYVATPAVRVLDHNHQRIKAKLKYEDFDKGLERVDDDEV